MNSIDELKQLIFEKTINGEIVFNRYYGWEDEFIDYRCNYKNIKIIIDRGFFKKCYLNIIIDKDVINFTISDRKFYKCVKNNCNKKETETKNSIAKKIVGYIK